jgi:pyruvate ferredoxin oxidoreductase alpha subunit
LDGFYLTHVIEPICIPEQAEVDKFIPPYQCLLPLSPDKPVTMGAFASPIIYTEAKWAQDVNLRAAKEVILQCWNDFGSSFGRYYSPVECYHCKEASVLLLTMGSFSETAMVAIDKMRQEGRDVGLLKLRLWRPFPFEEIRQAVKNAEVLIILDRALSFGGPGGPVCSEIRSALYNEEKKPKVISFVGGLGGRDITVAGFEEMVNKGIEISQKGSEKEFEIFEVRE